MEIQQFAHKCKKNCSGRKSESCVRTVCIVNHLLINHCLVLLMYSHVFVSNVGWHELPLSLWGIF